MSAPYRGGGPRGGGPLGARPAVGVSALWRVLAVAGAAAGLWLLSVASADAQALTTLCTSTPDAKVMQCESFVNERLDLAPGNYTVTVSSIDTAGNRTE